MAALNRRARSVMDRQGTFEVRVSDDLHAKIYSFSDSTVIIGSANLTWPAMTTNIEVVCELTQSDAAAFLRFLSKLRSRLTPVPAEVFTAYVEVAGDAISKPFDGPVEEDEEMNAAIDLAEETLRRSLVQTAPRTSFTPTSGIETFLEYCRAEKTDVSREIVARIGGKYNLQGHVKHCYHGVVQFLSEYPQFLAEIAATPGESLYDFTNISVRTEWRDFLHSHAKGIDEQRSFSFRTLRVYLPPSLGGICSGGGGGSGTLKRVLPVVARMLKSQAKKHGKD